MNIAHFGFILIETFLTILKLQVDVIYKRSDGHG